MSKNEVVADKSELFEKLEAFDTPTREEKEIEENQSLNDLSGVEDIDAEILAYSSEGLMRVAMRKELASKTQLEKVKLLRALEKTFNKVPSASQLLEEATLSLEMMREGEAFKKRVELLKLTHSELARTRQLVQQAMGKDVMNTSMVNAGNEVELQENLLVGYSCLADAVAKSAEELEIEIPEEYHNQNYFIDSTRATQSNKELLVAIHKITYSAKGMVALVKSADDRVEVERQKVSDLKAKLDEAKATIDQLRSQSDKEKPVRGKKEVYVLFDGTNFLNVPQVTNKDGSRRLAIPKAKTVESIGKATMFTGRNAEYTAVRTAAHAQRLRGIKGFEAFPLAAIVRKGQ